jgi:glutaminyl-peptide cyclotransferase
MRSLATPLIALALLVGCGGDDDEPAADVGAGFDAERAFADLEAQVELGPRPSGSAANRRNAELIVDRLRDAGVDAVRIQRPWRNVVGTIPGDLPGTVVVGAHYDTKDAIPGFVGANDGASGVAVVLELARALPDRLAGPSVQIVAFDAEEARGERDFERDGTRGSRQYVEYARAGGAQGSARLPEIRAMVLFDLVGDCDLEIPREENSDPGLYRVFSEAAQEQLAGVSPFSGTAAPILDDHIPFEEAGVPSVGLIDFEFGPGPAPGAFWHTRQDNLDHVCASSLDAVGETALAALPHIR